MLGKNVATHFGGGYLEKRYVDVYNPTKQDNRDASEIINEVFNRAGIKVV